MIYLDGGRFFFDIEGCFSNLIAEARAQAGESQGSEHPEELCKGFAKFFGTSPEKVRVGKDYKTVLKAILGEETAVLIPENDISAKHFAESFEHAAVISVKKAPDMKIKPEILAQSAESGGAAAIFITNPCCPTSLEMQTVEIEKLLSLTDVKVIVDESYSIDESCSAISLVPKCGNLTVLKKMRFGGEALFACGKSLPEFNSELTAANEAAAKIIFEHNSALKTAQRKLQDSIASLYIRIKKLAIKYDSLQRLYRSKANCVFFKCESAEQRANALFEKGIAVYQEGDYLCIFAGDKDENEAVLAALEEVL